ncbi:DUF6308 family protein [Amycolatopsis rhabdoformis]|uniref:DUF6308 family protein n=1 Tax=Amycolatopsis rhabdoformis TaxID=1448059 RepID=A0ABZ1I1B3_9PSEU|nr:DUF6308 family protein [Amycolatopsis rhabdoformis]WSE27939.1 DUF6308 family protein [Amycolatopsis rhabdoformis]
MADSGTTTPDPDRYRSQHDLLDDLVLGPGRSASLSALQRYFADGPLRESYTGRHFERFEGGGDALDVRDRVTSADVLALNFLSITDLAGVAVDTTVTHVAKIADLLQDIKTDTAMHEAEWSTYAESSPAYELWALFKRCGGKNRWVTANKLLARKRPHLIPVYDSRVQALLGAPERFWACLWTWFHTDDERRTDSLRELRSTVGEIEDISLLRCLDVAL